MINLSSSDQIRNGIYSGMIVLISWHSVLRLPVALISHAKDSLGISLSYPVSFFDIKMSFLSFKHVNDKNNKNNIDQMPRGDKFDDTI